MPILFLLSKIIFSENGISEKASWVTDYMKIKSWFVNVTQCTERHLVISVLPVYLHIPLSFVWRFAKFFDDILLVVVKNVSQIKSVRKFSSIFSYDTIILKFVWSLNQFVEYRLENSCFNVPKKQHLCKEK